MEIGILSQWDKKQFETKQKKGEAVKLGIAAESLLNDIEFTMYNTQYNAARTLQLIHHDLLLMTGRIKVEEKKEAEE